MDERKDNRISIICNTARGRRQGQKKNGRRRYKNQRRTKEMSVPFALSLTAGILIIFSSAIFTILLWILTMFGNGGFIGEMMNGDSMMGDIDGGFNNFMPFVTGILSVGILSGALVLVGSLMMYYKRSKQVKSWGIVVVIFSIVALIVGGGFLIGTILGIIGGALAIGRAR